MQMYLSLATSYQSKWQYVDAVLFLYSINRVGFTRHSIQRCFMKQVFQGDDEDETDEKVMQAICALGSQDRGISIWITK